MHMLELRKLLDNVEEMSEEIMARGEKYAALAADARLALEQMPVDEALRAKIKAAMEADHTWRGAEPFEDTLDRRHRPQLSAQSATLIGVDGSQIYPDRHGPALYYLINIGSIVFRHGSGEAPLVETKPTLYFSEADLYDRRLNLIPSEQINARRELAEVRQLADLANAERAYLGGDLERLIVALKDGQLMMWLGERNLFEGDSTADGAISDQVEHYVKCLQDIQRAGAVPVGFVGQPRSANVVRMLWVGSLSMEDINSDTVQASRYRALTDRALFAGLLEPNQRSAIFVTTALANRKVFASRDQKICFFYLNVAQRSGRDWAQIVRIDLPEWVAGQPDLVDRTQQALYDDCIGTHFPYVLARADELAVVSQQEKREFEHLLGVNLTLRVGSPPESSPKARQKELSRGYLTPMNEQTMLGRVLRSSTATYTFGYNHPDETPPEFGSLIQTSVGGDTVYGLVYDVVVNDDPFVRQIVAAGENLDETRIQDMRQRRQVPVEITALAIAYRQNGEIFQRIPPRPPGALQPIYACAAIEVQQVLREFQFFRTVLNSAQCPSEELVAASLRLAAGCQSEGGQRSYLLAAGRELARLLAADPPRLEAILRRLTP